MEPNIQSLFGEGVNVLLLVGGPIVLAIGGAGILWGIFQAATSIRDQGSAFAARLLGFLVVSYLLLPAFIRNVLNLTENAFK